jgi:CelD/BcsL family acetyltransferase involved in cellulose biosynthesis
MEWIGLPLSAALAVLILPAGVRGLRDARLVRENHRGAMLAFPLGAVLATAALVALAPLGVPRIGLLRVDGEAVACNYYFLFRDCMYFHELAFDPLLARWSPGQIATLDSIEAAAAEGARRVEFLGGAERYKLELADRFEPLYEAFGLARTVKGKVAVAGRMSGIRVRKQLKRSSTLRRIYFEGLAPARRFLARMH